MKIQSRHTRYVAGVAYEPDMDGNVEIPDEAAKAEGLTPTEEGKKDEGKPAPGSNGPSGTGNPNPSGSNTDEANKPRGLFGFGSNK